MAVKIVQAVINGVTTTLTYNSTSKKYEATITAPATSSYNNNAGHYFPVTIKATDEAGNVTTKNDTDATLGSSLQLRVKKPVVPDGRAQRTGNLRRLYQGAEKQAERVPG